MALFHDKSITTLNKLGYDSIKYPKPGISPLDFIIKSSGAFSLFSSLPTIWLSNNTPPAVKEELVPGLDIIESSEFYGGVGISTIINGVFNAGLNLASLSGIGVKLIVKSPKRIYCDHIELANYIKNGDLDYSQAISEPFLDDRTHVYLITEVLASSNLNIIFLKRENKELSVNVSEISKTISANSNIEVSGTSINEISFHKRNSSVTFGFKQTEILYDEKGYWSLALPQRSGRVFLGGKPSVMGTLLRENEKISF